ncbi:glycoside hydrolase [Amylocystis lapponica]|nr:glycoside hydrolase [Amylocystis lapponica]
MSALALRPLFMLFVLCATTLHTVLAAPSFAGSSLYYAAGLSDGEADTLLQGLQSADMKVLRVWLDGQGTIVCNGNEDCYNDTVLKRMDNFMVKAESYGVKLLISMHSFNALQGGDVYGKKYGVANFYSQSGPQQAFDARLKHVLNHNHTTLGKPWKELSDYIFAFEPENESMIGQGQGFIQDHTSWQCDRATTVKGELGDNSGILVTTGGESWLSESVQDAWLKCAALDIISIHAYGPGDLTEAALTPYVKKAQSAGKKLLLEEWGACYFSTSNNDCPTGGVLNSQTRNNNIQKWASAITAAGLPWLYWQVLPQKDPHSGYDYEIAVNSDPSWGALKAAAQAAGKAEAAFDFSANIISSNGTSSSNSSSASPSGSTSASLSGSTSVSISTSAIPSGSSSASDAAPTSNSTSCGV